MIVVISHPGDRHAQLVLEDLACHGQQTFLFDLADLPDRASIVTTFDDSLAPAVTVDHAELGSVDLSGATSVWWRRPQAPTLDAISGPGLFRFTHGEWHAFLNSLYPLIQCPWMNHPVQDEFASRKALQLLVAAQLGFRIPRTLMTSNAERAQSFIDQQGQGRVIYKTFASTEQIWRPTRLVQPNDVDMADSIRDAPSIFQEYIPATADIRVTIVGSEVFAVAIDARGTNHEVDFRVRMSDSEISVCVLPDGLIRRLHRLLRKLGLVYGAIDLRHTEDDDYVFLEINPAGEFLFVEHNTGLPIASAVSRWLRRPY